MLTVAVVLAGLVPIGGAAAYWGLYNVAGRDSDTPGVDRHGIGPAQDGADEHSGHNH